MEVPKQKTSENQRLRAISKLHAELEKDIARAVEIARSCGLWDLLRLLYEFRLARLCMILPECRQALTPAKMASFHLNDEGMRYAISLVAKYGKWDDSSAIETPLADFDIFRVHKLESVTRHINAKFETEILLNIADVQVIGERDQECLIDLEAGIRDPVRNMHFQFGLRVENFTRDEKNDPVPISDLIDRFRDEYSVLSELYESDNGISVDDFCQGMLDIHNCLVARGIEAEAELLGKCNGLVDPLLAETFIRISRTFIMTDAELSYTLSPNFLAYLRRNAFDSTVISDSELRYHYISRRPFLIGNGIAIFSPELVFDSILGNTRYTFLESVKSKQRFMQLSAAQFVDKISSVAAHMGYRVVGRDIYLKDGKKDIGDIDLFLWNADTSHSLLIEAKNHTLPLPVYFRNPKAVDDHVARNRDWESKVKRRIAHLKSDERSFCIIGDWDYLVVTLMPEPLSHVTDILILSLDEFVCWLSENPRPSEFSQLHDIMHNRSSIDYSVEEMKQMQEDGLVLLKPYVK
jgi:hypothetical protein